MNTDDFFYRLLNSGQQRHPGIGGGMPQTVNALAGQGVMPSPAPVQSQTPQPASVGYQMPEPQGNSGGFLSGIGNAVQGLLAPQSSGRNETVNWLQSQGLDAGTATLLAGNKSALQKYLIDRAQGADPMDALKQEKLGLEIEQMRNPTTDDIKEYQFAKQNGYLGSFADWRNGGAAKPSAIQEYEYAKGQGFPGTFQDWEASKKGGMSLQVNPDTGEVTFQQGGNIKPMTEAQSKDTVYATRAQGVLPTLDKYGSALTSLPEAAGGAIPGVGNYLKTAEYQQAEQAGREFLQAVLRKDTGAAITKDEMDNYGAVYLPVPGDSPEVLAQKKLSRARALEAMKAGMPPQAILAQEKALQRTGDTERNRAMERPQTSQPSTFSSQADIGAAINAGEVRDGDIIILNGKRQRVNIQQ